MAKLFDIQDTTVAISDLTLTTTRGEFKHEGNVDVGGDISHVENVNVKNTLTATTIVVSNLITSNGDSTQLGQWLGSTESDINGKGFSWSWGTGQSQLIYRGGGRLWTNSNFDLGAGSSYKINNTPVLSAGVLGASITTSSLNEVGTLNSLSVSGNASIGDFLFANSTVNRLGIGTDEPSASVTILDNNVEITLGSPRVNVAQIGTASNHDLALATDGQPRITIKNSGDVVVPGNITVNGTLTVDNLVTDSRVDRTHPIQFLPTKTSSIYGLGLVWASADSPHQFTLLSGPDRMYSSDHVDLASAKSYHINTLPVLSQDTLGASVVNSSLTTVGTLNNLNVAGSIQSAIIAAPVINVFSDNETLTIKHDSISANSKITLSVGTKEAFYSDSTETIIGDVTQQNKPTKVFGPLSVNINNPDPSLSFSVAGDVSIGNKRFTNGPASPTSGSYLLGDICWNSNPQANSFIGWVCVFAGTPGQWLPFGNIATQ
jgi:hypothetical protein